MDRLYRFRITLVSVLVLVMAVIFTGRLFGIQLGTRDAAIGGSYSASNTSTYTQNVSAARGEILDRHGTVLVSNRATYSVTLNSFVLFNADDPNGSLLKLAETCQKNGIKYTDSLPLTMTAPYAYDEEKLGSTFSYFLLGRDWDADMTADNLARRLKSSYHIPEEWTETQARLVIGLRYELDLPIYANTATYVLAEDVSADQLAILKELGIPGMDVTTSTVREYNTIYAAQLLGHVQSMLPGQFESTYEAMGYSMDAKVGQDGLEAGFEELLHGTDGVKVVTVASDGTVLDEYWETEPRSGANVITTIDIGLQEAAEKSLQHRITNLAESTAVGKDGYDADSGAMVIMDPRNGEVLAAASYPSYDPADYFEKYNELMLAKGAPLQNRALNNAYPPGSTFKMITSVAAMRAGIAPGFTVDGQGYYKFDDGTTLSCWIVNSGGVHGVLDMRGALANSCNIYFYTVGMMTGIDMLDQTAWSFGIGQDPGSEVATNFGQMASPEVKKEAYPEDKYNDWFYADTATASIGQNLTQVTPLQLCRYVSCIANKGTLYNTTFLRRAVSSDFQTLVKGNDYTPAATEVISPSEYQVLYEGMRQCATEGTGKKLKDYPVACCAKTGTASHGSGGSDHGVFVCWAPAEDPEICIAIYIEHGASGSNFAEAAMDVMDYYFGTQDSAQEIAVENAATEG